MKMVLYSLSSSAKSCLIPISHSSVHKSSTFSTNHYSTSFSFPLPPSISLFQLFSSPIWASSQIQNTHMKKFILKLDLHDDKEKRKALKTVSALPGIDSITMNMKEKTLIVVGTVDPINVVSKLRKFWSTDIISVGPAKEPEKKEETKKEDGKKEDAKKDEDKKDEAKKDDDKKEEAKKKEGDKEEEKKKAVPPQPTPGMLMPYRPYYHPINTYYNYQQYHPYQAYQHNYQPRHHSIEENPNACVIS